MVAPIDPEAERDFVPVLGQAEEQTRRAGLSAALLSCVTPVELRYGAGDRERIDLYLPAKPTGAVALYFHGGYWRGGDRRSSAFVAGPLFAAGVSVAVAGYDLAPAVTLAQIVAQARAARDALLARTVKLGLDSHRFLLAGSSAGAHLSAMLLLDGPSAWPAPPVASLITGVYDLGPVVRTSVNADLGLTPEDVETLSPIRRNEPFYARRILVSVGGDETPAWQAASAAFAERARRDAPTEFVVLPNRNHFSISTGLGLEDDPLSRSTFSLFAA